MYVGVWWSQMYQVSSKIWSDGSELILVRKKKERKKERGRDGGGGVQAYPTIILKAMGK